MIKFKSVYLRQKGRTIFSGLDLFISEKEKVLITGKSGIGKTTLFRILLGFESVDRGEVRVNGLEICRENIRDIRGKIFYLSQDVDLKDGVIAGLIDEILEINSIEKPARKDFKTWMDLLELEDNILDQPVRELSGGERQRIGLLICFLLDRPVWLLDEPTSALDDAMKKKLAEFILAREKTILIVSHDDVWEKSGPVRKERWV
ncbi:ABC transporter ATP-binding protein [Desulfospira joergensenii]|uniref:ABC transporter ATP-binding protein n=1 Tax=Desulfospira joergensenii TaxID=53329 RepID=UPI0003FC0AAA|nr:ATP-binding cassette domain-containing protein [Desulfospira joergensenii]